MKTLFSAGLIFYVFHFCGIAPKAQIPSGAWRDHLPYWHASRLAQYDNRIFCATTDGSLFSYNLKDQSLTKHSKVNGLSDADISTIGSSGNSGTFVVGYRNGNIDMIRNDSIINLPDIKRKMIMGGKSVNNIFFLDRFAYLACDFGIVVLDIGKREIKETYFFGPNGTQITVNDIASDGTYLLAATNQGIYRAALDDPNLLDFNSWFRLPGLPDPTSEYRYIAAYNNKYFTLYPDPVSGLQNIVNIGEFEWNIWPNSVQDNYEFIGQQNGNLIVTNASRIKIYGESELLILDETGYFPRHVLFDTDNSLWYAALFGGLVNLDKGLAVIPAGPPYRDAGDIEARAGNIWIGGGTFVSQWSGYGAYSFIDEKWNQYNGSVIPELKDFLNISEIAFDPLDPNHVIGGSYGWGIAEFLNGTLIDIENESGGIMKPVTGYEGEPGYLRITGIDFNKDGVAYAVGSNAETVVYRKARDGDWTAIDIEYDGFGFNVNTGDLLVNSSGQVWVLATNHGILVFTDADGVPVQERFIKVVENQFGEVFDFILAVAEDKDGDIWIGTNKGPVIFNPGEIFEVQNVIGYQPVIPRNDGTTFASLLLSSEQINDIEVDGANRKWLATEKTGVYLVSSDGKKEIHHFTAENSPLLSNSVQKIAVNDKTGEVFFGTDKGIISFRSGATEGGDDFGDVYVFPNPVRENFEGDITVTGLAKDVNVKITDIAGNIIHETTALGGQATWNGKNFRGERVQTGVYLVFCTSEDGSKTYITKLLFIH
jgi:hypothetical protein